MQPTASRPESTHETLERPPEETARELVGRARHAVDAASERARRAETWAERNLERPVVGGVAIGTALLVAGAVVGASEAIVAGLGGWLAYRMLARRRAARG